MKSLKKKKLTPDIPDFKLPIPSGELRVFIDTKQHVMWEVFVKKTSEIESDEQVFELTWGFDWENNLIKMQESALLRLRDKINQIIKS